MLKMQLNFRKTCRKIGKIDIDKTIVTSLIVKGCLGMQVTRLIIRRSIPGALKYVEEIK